MFLIKIFFYICSSIFKINNNAAIKNDKISYFENSNHASTLWKLILRQKKWYFYKKCVGPFVKTQKKNQSSSSFNRLEGRNPLDSKGKIIRCTICESIHHWAKTALIEAVKSMTHGCRMKLFCSKPILITLIS